MRPAVNMVPFSLYLIVLFCKITFGLKFEESYESTVNPDLKFYDVGHIEEAADGYADLAAISGGSVISSNKTDIDRASAIAVAEASLANPVIVMATQVDAPVTRDISFSVDMTLTEILVEVIGQVDKRTITLENPKGWTIAADGRTLAVDSQGALVYKIQSPLTGCWQLRCFGTQVYDVIIKGSSVVSFQHSFMQQKPGIPFLFQISGDPPAGKNLTVKIEVNAIDETRNITLVTLYSLNGDVIKSAPLTQISRRESNTFKSVLSLPAHAIRIGITGMDKNGTPLTRISKTAIAPESAITVKFNHTKETVTVYHLPFTAFNRGPTGNLTADVTSDSMNLKVSISPAVFLIQQNHSYTGSVTVKSLDSTQLIAGNILLVITGPTGVSQFDSTLVSIPPYIAKPHDNGGTHLASALIGLVMSYLVAMAIL